MPLPHGVRAPGPRLFVCIVALASLLPATAAFAADSAEERTARFAKVQRWAGTFECAYERKENARDDGFTVGPNKKKAEAEGHVRIQSGGTFTLVREKKPSGDDVRWVLEKAQLHGLIDEFGAQVLGATRMEKRVFGDQLAPPDPPCVPGPTPEEACPEETGEVFLSVREGQAHFSCPYVKVEVTRTTSAGAKQLPPEKATHEVPVCVNVVQELPSGTQRLGGVSKTRHDFGMPMSVRSAVFPDDLRCEWSLAPAGVEMAQEPIVEGPKCTCAPDGVLELTARPAPGSEGGTFNHWEVKSSGKGATAKVLANEGGAKPRLRLSGDGSQVGETTAVAVYMKGGAVLRSAPFSVSFCKMEELKLLDSLHQSAKSDSVYIFGSEAAEEGPNGIRAEAKVWRGGVDVSKDVKWELLPNPNGAWEMKELTGPRRAFRLPQLPRKNDDFGKKRVVATYEREGCAAVREKEVTVLFDRDARTNPGPRGDDGRPMPNWSYYWAQTSAGRGFTFQLVKTAPPPVPPCTDFTITEVREPNAVAFYDWCRDVLFLREHLVGPVPGVQGEGCAKRPDGSSDVGIDCFAVNLRHEARHQEQFTRWWGPRMSRYSVVNDTDADKVPNDVERATPGCSAVSPRSCPGRPSHLQDAKGNPANLLDLELDAYHHGWKWRRGSADPEDWASPGKQSP